MRLFLGLLPDGAIRVRGALQSPDHGTITVVSQKGNELCGLSYEEAIQYAWVETDDSGQFVSGEKLPPPAPDDGSSPPPFLR